MLSHDGRRVGALHSSVGASGWLHTHQLICAAPESGVGMDSRRLGAAVALLFSSVKARKRIFVFPPQFIRIYIQHV